MEGMQQVNDNQVGAVKIQENIELLDTYSYKEQEKQENLFTVKETERSDEKQQSDRQYSLYDLADRVYDNMPKTVKRPVQIPAVRWQEGYGMAFMGANTHRAYESGVTSNMRDAMEALLNEISRSLSDDEEEFLIQKQAALMKYSLAIELCGEYIDNRKTKMDMDTKAAALAKLMQEVRDALLEEKQQIEKTSKKEYDSFARQIADYRTKKAAN